MKLKEFLKYNRPRDNTVFLWFKGKALQYQHTVSDDLLDMEVMELVRENGYNEVWLK